MTICYKCRKEDCISDLEWSKIPIQGGGAWAWFHPWCYVEVYNENWEKRYGLLWSLISFRWLFRSIKKVWWFINKLSWSGF